ncbi:unnamed protein product [Phytophthora fragariaefolia]|uniref:Unnamed protein product n=1 Tax=Phytophthora fragariaefolia TaxID=1490495 RepID=A0A9W6YF73_9STRA|nr:unnamed protein product [Phytophthora fragariaefolia]
MSILSVRANQEIQRHFTRSVASKDAWAVLYRAGWTSKRANERSLDLRYRYVRPGGDPNGKEGDDVFEEQAVTNHYRQLYCVENSDDIAGNDCGGGDERADDFRPGELDDPNEDVDRKAWISVVSAANAKFSSGAATSRYRKRLSTRAMAAQGAVQMLRLMLQQRCVLSARRNALGHGSAQLELPIYTTSARTIAHCYKTVTHPASIPPVRPPVGDAAYGSTTTNAVDAQSTASLRAVSHSSVRPKKAVTTKKAGASINSQANTSKTSTNSFSTSSLPNAAPPKATSKPRFGKQKAQQAPSKPKIKTTTTTNAAALRNELSRRLQATASNFVNAIVAIALPNEDWMETENFSSVGAAFLVGVVILPTKKMLTICA